MQFRHLQQCVFLMARGGVVCWRVHLCWLLEDLLLLWGSIVERWVYCCLGGLMLLGGLSFLGWICSCICDLLQGSVVAGGGTLLLVEGSIVAWGGYCCWLQWISFTAF